MEMPQIGKPKMIEAPMGLYFMIKIGSPLELGGTSIILRAIDLSDHPRQIKIPRNDWELLRNEIDKEFGLIIEVLEEEIEEK